MPKTICIAVILATVFLATWAHAGGAEISSFVEQGIIHYTRGELDEAIEDFSNGVQASPNDYMAYFQRAKVYEYREDADKAIADYTAVLKACPGFIMCPQALYYRGLMYQRKNLEEEAIKDYTAIIDSNCESKGILANAYNNRGLAFDRRGRFDDALSDYSRALDVMPRLINAYYNRGAAYASLGAYTLALQDFEKELEINKRSISASRYKLAIMYYEKKEYAKSWFELFALMQSGERVSHVLIEDLKRLRAKSISETGALVSGVNNFSY
ncbi:MAG TPA: tetratricopeptide repeat protein [Candidatus Margulisiibacteriota bacterium]|nr:tetratricopeptide repeat protein [Candidatus Margulisiibacteriota bacterium]